jgi:hypothetical protein
MDPAEESQVVCQQHFGSRVVERFMVSGKFMQGSVGSAAQINIAPNGLGPCLFIRRWMVFTQIGHGFVILVQKKKAETNTTHYDAQYRDAQQPQD